MPKVKNLSENITVKSTIGRFLEHARILYFYNNGKEKLFISTADWMVRNFDKRIELLYEVNNPMAKKFLKTVLKVSLSDKTAWELDNYTYKRVSKNYKVLGSQYLFLKNISKITSLIIPPPIAVTRPSTTTPNTSICFLTPIKRSRCSKRHCAYSVKYTNPTYHISF